MAQTITLGKHEARLLFTLEEQGRSVFTFREAMEILKLPRASTANVILRLKKKNRVKEIERGKYLLVPARAGLEAKWAEDVFSIVDVLLDDYYIGFITALSYWGLTDQIPRTILVATPKRKRILFYNGLKIQFVTINPKRFFGYIVEKYDNVQFKISSIEKTIVDCLLYPKYCLGITEIVKAIFNAKEQIDWQKLLEFVDKVKVNAVKRRLGYILELLNIGHDIVKALEGQFKGYRWLDPSHVKEIKSYNKKWGLILNVLPEEILNWEGS